MKQNNEELVVRDTKIIELQKSTNDVQVQKEKLDNDLQMAQKERDSFKS